ncbi:MAG: DUF4312 family protein [Bulleidia sp.]|nr:DUF4312 family protein [Bulleidia sp.]
MAEQLLRNITKTFEVTSKGEKYVNVVGDLFTQLRSKVYEDLDGKPLINMKATEVYFDDVKVDKYTERFMFVFWPRERRNYTITARIVVVIDYLDRKEEDIT